MPVLYKISKNKLTAPHSYIASPVFLRSVENDELSESISTTLKINKSVCLTVLEALPGVCKDILLDGKSINLSGFISISLSVKYKLENATDPLPSGNLSCNCRFSKEYSDEITEKGTVQKDGYIELLPSIFSTMDTNFELNGLIREGFGFLISGSNLSIDVLDSSQGVYIKRSSLSTEYTKETNISVNENSQLVIIPSSNVDNSSNVCEFKVQVRTRLDANSQLKVSNQYIARGLNTLSLFSRAVFLTSQNFGSPVSSIISGDANGKKFFLRCFVKSNNKMYASVSTDGLSYGADSLIETSNSNHDLSSVNSEINITFRVLNVNQLRDTVDTYSGYITEYCLQNF